MKKNRYSFKTLNEGASLGEGAKGDDVWNLQSFLTSAGYLRRERVPGTFCKWTAGALRQFQKNYGLSPTGEADEATLHLIQRPRCGVPDFGPQNEPAEGLAPFVLRGCKYNRTDLTFAFSNSTSDLPGDRALEIVREAFRAWKEVSTLHITEVSLSEAPTFTVSWERGNHGDGSGFDDGGTIQGNVLAHAFFPPPCGGMFSGAIHFDEFEQWTDDASPGAIRLLNVAIHEIGHLLGLDHSNIRNAIMFAFYDDAVDRLFKDDIEGIRALYGEP
jgi:hypothetical protein